MTSCTWRNTRDRRGRMRRRLPWVIAFLVGLAASESNAQWRVDPKPVLDIGGAAAADDYLFQFVSGTARLSNGNIVVADGNSRELKVFGRTGQFVKRIGRDGEGPGEFKFPKWFAVARADTMLVYDSRGSLGFLNKFTADG